METSPTFSDAFASTYAKGNPQLVWTRLIADLETPVSAMLKLGGGETNSFLFESVEDGKTRGRYSIIGLAPDLIFRANNGQAEINRNAREDVSDFAPLDAPPLEALRTLIDECRLDVPHELPPMSSGLFGYAGYDMVREMEHLPNINPDPIGIPDAIFLRPTIIAIFDGVTGELIVVSPVWPSGDIGAEAAYERAQERIANVVARLESALPHTPVPDGPLPTPKAISNTTHAEYLKIVDRAKEYIKAGDVFQVVPSQRFAAPFALPPFALYRALRRLNPSPYLFFLDFGSHAIVGSSPEILVKLSGDTVTIRPIAGTRPRGATPEEDRALADDLLGDPKERAEHLMLLDLGRNDVGRVVKTGTVDVTESFTIENYSHVMHIVSNVEGEIAENEDALSALVGGFPAGTVSGAPKVRAMEIIDELEKEKRGIYAGGVGYFAADGSMDTCIALRTALVKDGTMYVQAGGGVVYDSDPDAEYQETMNKAKALIRAAEEAVRFANKKPGNLKTKF